MQRSKHQRKIVIGIAALATAGGLAGTAVSAGASGSSSAAASGRGVALDARLLPLNNSGGVGHADVHLRGRHAHVKIRAHGLAPGLPHAQHIHFGKDARHECPSVFDDENVDQRLTTAEGVPAYGPVRKSLTTSGDTSPGSALAVDRFPTAPNGHEHYERTITFKKSAVRRAIRHGKGVIVIHGVDYNSNGEYDFDSAGKSDLDPALPAEATDPAVCGVLR